MSHNIGGNIGRWIHSFLINRSLNVCVNGKISKTAKVLSSVPQGTVLAPILFLIMINDINKDISFCNVDSFADDTKISKNISKETIEKQIYDKNILQKGLDKIIEWSIINNIEFNYDKFFHITYSNKNDECQRNYQINESKIKITNQIRDLGIIMNNDLNFTSEIEKSVNKARQKIGLILRNFKTRDETIMLTLYKAIIRPHLEYGSYLVYPKTKKESQLLEGVQRTFTSKITSIKNMNYWERLKKLKIYSLERRRERYSVIHIWKILEKQTENLSINPIFSRENNRRGRLCIIPSVKSKTSQKLKNIKRNSFAVRGPILFNSLPKSIRNIRNAKVEVFKKALDNWLQKIPDEPSVEGYTKFRSKNSNSIMDQNPKGWRFSSP